MEFEEQRGQYSVSCDKRKLDVAAVHDFLTHSYWSEGIPLDLVERAVEHSLCFGLFDGGKQIGFARVVSDRATYAYLCDVYVLEQYRGKGLGTWLMSCVVKHPDLQGLRRFALLTRDAHGLYRKFGFTPAKDPLRHVERYMEIHVDNIYKKSLKET